VVRSDSKIDEVWSEKLREKIEGRYGGRKKKEREWCVTVGGKGSASLSFSFFTLLHGGPEQLLEI